MEKPKDRDFIETQEGLLFCVVGYLHPSDRYTAYLKYIPDQGGKWSRDETRYARAIPYYHVSQIENTYEYLRENHPDYLHECPVRNITVSSVPRNRTAAYHRPRERMAEILDGPGDDLEWKLSDLTTILKGLSGLRTRDLGVTGSMLTRSHSPKFSDIDLTVYGEAAARSLKEAFVETRRNQGVIQPFNAAKKRLWSETRAGRFPLSPGELTEFAERRWNYGVFSDTYFSIHPVRTDAEITEEYGDNVYTRIGEVTGTATVSDSTESVFLPAVYKIEDPELTGSSAEVTEIVSFEGIFCDMFEEGERIEFGGILERVEGEDEHNRVVIGGAGTSTSFMKHRL